MSGLPYYKNDGETLVRDVRKASFDSFKLEMDFNPYIVDKLQTLPTVNEIMDKGDKTQGIIHMSKKNRCNDLADRFEPGFFSNRYEYQVDLK